MVLRMDLISKPSEIPNVIARHEATKSDMEAPPQYKDEVTKLTEKMTLKRMAVDTIKLYKNCFTQFIKHYESIHPEDITKDQIIKYILQRVQAGNFSETQQNNFISAIKCYCWGSRQRLRCCCRQRRRKQ